MPSPFSLDFGLPFEEAIATAERRGAVLPEAFYGELPEELRQYAFTVSEISALDQVQAVLDSLNRKIAEGQSFQEWKKEALASDWNIPNGRLETIARTHAQTAYMAGHWSQFQAGIAERPYLLYTAINDGRTRPTHRALSGTVAPVNDPFWLTHSPPLGFNCRCSLISLTHSQAVDRGIGQRALPSVQPDPGFGYPPQDAVERMKQLLEQRARDAGPAFVDVIERIEKRGFTFPPLTDGETLAVDELRAQLVAKYGDAYDALTDGEIFALRSYAQDSFPVNAYMRGLRDLGDEGLRDIVNVQAAIDKLADGTERLTFRGAMSDPRFNALAERVFIEGKVLKAQSFLSTSGNEMVAADFSDRYVITVRGSSAAQVDGFYQVATEDEYLYPAGTNFRVVKVRRIGDVWYIDLVETDEPFDFLFTA